MIKYKKYNFNLIEVALAMAILAIGIASILVLFPVGVNANKSAIANNNLADIAEYMMGYLRGRMSAEWNDSGSSTFRSNLPSSYENLKEKEEEDSKDYTLRGDITTNWNEEENGTDISQGTRLYTHKTAKGVFLFQQLTKIENGSTSDYVADFSAIVKVWVDNINDFQFYDVTGKFISSSGIDDLDKYLTALCIEFSWPAEAPYGNRETRVFRFEVFNEFFKLIP